MSSTRSGSVSRRWEKGYPSLAWLGLRMFTGMTTLNRDGRRSPRSMVTRRRAPVTAARYTSLCDPTSRWRDHPSAWVTAADGTSNQFRTGPAMIVVERQPLPRNQSGLQACSHRTDRRPADGSGRCCGSATGLQPPATRRVQQPIDEQHGRIPSSRAWFTISSSPDSSWSTRQQLQPECTGTQRTGLAMRAPNCSASLIPAPGALLAGHVSQIERPPRRRARPAAQRSAMAGITQAPAAASARRPTALRPAPAPPPATARFPRSASERGWQDGRVGGYLWAATMRSPPSSGCLFSAGTPTGCSLNVAAEKGWTRFQGFKKVQPPDGGRLAANWA